MRPILALLVVVLAACTHTEASAPATPGVRFEVLSKKPMDSLDGEVFVRFRAKNEGAGGVAYRGFEATMPAYSLEYEQDGKWLPFAMGWCGTGIQDFTLQPGAAIEFDVPLRADGRTYRAKFGEPEVVTPPVVAKAD